MMIEAIVENDIWDAVGFEGLAIAACEASLHHFGIDPLICEASIMACDDARITELNANFRDKQQATNVLSWPAEDLSLDADGQHPRRPTPDFKGGIDLGDIAIAFETCQREAQALRKPLEEHVTHLIVHGMLHLLGYDHIRDFDATLMQEIEIEILGNLGLDNPYRE